MDTSVIRKLLRKFKCFKGVYPSDRLPYNFKPPINIIINTDPSYKPGEHWVCISINTNLKGYYFDSFGLPPLKKDIIDFLDKKCKKGWKYNKYSLQHLTSTTCGHYCVTYIIFRCQGYSPKYYLSKFNNNTLENDERMRKLYGNFSLVKDF